MSRLGVPVIVIVIGEGGSGGALGVAVGNRIYMLQNAWYSVISPESCAAIIYRDSARAPEAAAALKITAPDLLNLGLIDGIIPEPGEGAHTDPDAAAEAVRITLRAEPRRTFRDDPEAAHRRPLRQVPQDGLLLHRDRGGEAYEESRFWSASLIVLVILGVIVYSSMNLASHRYEACMTFSGQTNCRIASGSTEQFAIRTAISNACAGIASGVTDSIACEQSQPTKLTKLK